MILALADCPTCLSDLAPVRVQRSMFGPVARVRSNGVADLQLDRSRSSYGASQRRAWPAGAGPAGEELIIDFDATLINAKADKQDALGIPLELWGHPP